MASLRGYTSRELRGFHNLVRNLNELKDTASKRAARAGVNAGLTVLARTIRQAVNGTSASPQLKAAARKTVAKRLNRAQKTEGKPYVGKAGFAVGKQGDKKKMTAHERFVYGQGGARLARGVGVSASNIHWFVLGTQQRTTRRGHRTGKIFGLLAGAVQSACVAAQSGILEAARSKVSQVLAAWAAKTKKG